MSFVKSLVAIVFGTVSLQALAEPLYMELNTSGTVVTLDGRFTYLGGARQGAPVAVDFAKEYNTSFATVNGGTLTLLPDPYFYKFEISTGGARLGVDAPGHYAPQNMNTIQLRNDVRNAAGDLVDVFELTAVATKSSNARYTSTTSLEFASTTFGDFDAWSILNVTDAALLGGTFTLNEVVEGWDGTFQSGNMIVALSDFDVRFAGPGAEVPPVPEPAHGLMLLAGLATLGAVRRHSSARRESRREKAGAGR